MSSDISNIKPKSTWKPQKNYHTINTFIEALDDNIDELFKQKQTFPRNNISQHEKKIISKLSKQKVLVFTKADKGGTTVIVDVGDYVEKDNKEVKYENYYKKIENDPTHDNLKVVNDTLDTFHRQQILPKNIAENLEITNIRTPHSYITPKVPKKDIPGRPVVSCIDCHTGKLSNFVDYYLKPNAKTPLFFYYQSKNSAF